MLAHKLLGTGPQIAVCQLEPGQTAYCAPGRFVWKTPNVSVSTRRRPPFAASAEGSSIADLLFQALDVGARVLAGETRAITYAATGGSGLVAFAGVLPGGIRCLELDGSDAWYAERNSFLVAEGSVELLTAPVPGSTASVGAGAVLGRFTGTGTVLLAGGGTLVELNPARYGGTLQCDPGSLVAFSEPVSYRVERPESPDAPTSLGGRGSPSLATLEGDGSVILQSLRRDRLPRSFRRGGTDGTQQRPVGGFLSGIDD